MLDRPHKYVGARELFGERTLPEGKYSCTYEKLCIRRINHLEMDDTYKYKHKKDVRVETFEGLPSSLKYSIRYFILVQKLMDYLPGIASKHRSMMINVSRFVDVQNNLYDVIKLWLNERLVPQIKKYGMMPNVADDIYSGEFHCLKMIWDKEGFEQVSGIKWSDFSPALLSDIKRIRVALQNNSKKSKEPNVGLNYDNYKDGDRVIVVGGQCLSRGLTIEGLVVSYFYRNSATYDTLLQMGRWFGYRSEYLKYFRIWISEQSLEWYKLITDACEDLRLQVKKMNEKKMSPSQFGLAVKYHIATGLIVTARNKMRNGKKGRRVPTDLCGQLIESPRLYYNAATNNENRSLIDGFISSISSHPLVKSGSGCCWQNIDKSEISSFVKKFQSAKLSIGFKVEELADYINMHSTPLWNVAISQNTVEDVKSGKYKGIERPYVKDTDNGIMKIYGHHVRIGSKSTTQLGLSDEEIEAIKEKVGITEWKNNSSLSSYFLTNPGGFKRNSVLILYPLRLYEKCDDNTDSFRKYYSESKDQIVWGVGLGFAGDKNAEKDTQCFEYIINPVAQDIDAEWNCNSPEEDDIQDEKD